MLKVNSEALVGPLNSVDLKDHIEMIREKQQELLRERLQKNQEKEERIKTVQKQFVEWADKKQHLIKQKIEKSQKNKEDHLNKIVKKLQQHQKYLGQKLRNHQTKKRANLKQAWLKAEKLNDNIITYHRSKTMGRNSTIKHRTLVSQDMSNSILIQDKHVRPDQSTENMKHGNTSNIYLTTPNINLPNKSKAIGISDSKPYLSNESKERFMRMSIYDQRDKRKINEEIEEVEEKAEKSFEQKLRETLARFKKSVEEEQNEKIQLLGEHLQKIQKTRLKRLQAYKKKRQNSPRSIPDQDNSRRKMLDKQNRKSDRVKSEYAVKEKRVHDWSIQTQQRREELFNAKLQHDNHYLEQEKLRFLKTTVAKKIAMSAIQKKLFMERMAHAAY